MTFLMSLKEIVDDLYVALVGNRITALGSALLFAGSASLFDYDWANIPAMGIGFILIYQTRSGLDTVREYRRANQVIEENGKLRYGYVKSLCQEDEGDRFYGYCKLQGAYLAARRAGQLRNFELARAKYSSIVIPNF